MKHLALLLAGAVLLSAQTISKLSYPPAPKIDQVDDYHGTKIVDPYRTLENADSPATQQWIEEENKLTADYLAKTPGREAIKEQLTQLWNYEKFSGFIKAGSNYFYFHNSGLQNQPVLFTQTSLHASPRELLDPNQYRRDGTAALNGRSVSWNGKLLGYGVAQAGSDWTEWHVREVATGKDLPDVIRWTKSGGVSWTPDDGGFYYERYPEPPADQLLTVAAANQKVYFHKLGDPQSADKLIYERPDLPTSFVFSTLMEGGRYLIFYVASGASGKNMLFYQDLKTDPGHTIDLIPTEEHTYQPFANVGSTLYVLTNDGAPRSKVIAIDLEHPARDKWKDIVPERDETLDEAQLADGKLLLSYMKDAHSVARVTTADGTPISEVPMPGIGTAAWSPARLHDKEMFYSFAGFTFPPAYYRLSLDTLKSEAIHASKVAVDVSGLETKQVFYNSKDGTRIPMFVCYKKGLKLDGQNPTMLYAYGGFNVAITPAFSPTIMEWLQMGGVYASANLRGGSEYGEAWHQAGMKANKQNVFDDFIAAGEWLIANKYTSTPKLAISGASNGGLLVGAVLDQRPDLFGAAMPAVGVMDMLRFHKFGFGMAWAQEYGSPDNAEDFKVIRRYSPLQNIRPGVQYPATLITTSDHDDRVMPGHSLKFAATLQQAQEGPAPILLRVETRAGHGAGKPTSKQIDEWVDRFVFLKMALRMDGKS